MASATPPVGIGPKRLVVGAHFGVSNFLLQRLTAMLEYMPNVTDIQVYRLNTQAGWELILDQQTNLALRFAVRNRYTSDMRLAKPNDLDYAALLMWKF